ncbi:hypothetical protein LWI29_037974 [Acer saccharum]|uniref:C2 domain-containing protein n=1 Tax=Acer saccharum TaxID=4024 RepID=A0AA39W3W2_ACESA|nr:hypothetical protein LWI29_037974 [Acer saccharum]
MFGETSLKFQEKVPRNGENGGDNLKTSTKVIGTSVEVVKMNLGREVERGRKTEAKLVRISWDGTRKKFVRRLAGERWIFGGASMDREDAGVAERGHQALLNFIPKKENVGDMTEKGNVFVPVLSKAKCEAEKADIVDSHHMGIHGMEKDNQEVGRGYHRKGNDKAEFFKKSVNSFWFKESGERAISKTIFKVGQVKRKRVYVRKSKFKYCFAHVSSLRSESDVEVWSKGGKDAEVNEQDFLGEASCFLSEIVTKQNRTSTLNLHDKRTGVSRNLGTLSVHAEETVASRSAIEISFHCSHLANVDLFSKSDPFLRISRIVENGDCVPICKTKVINDNSNPIWRPITLSMQQCGSKENPLIIECFDFNASGNHVLLGKIQKSMADQQRLHQEQSGANFVLPSAHHNHEKVLKSQQFVDKCIEKEQYTFLDYISSGFELNFMVAVDFTVGEVIQFYDSDRRFPAWGFGGNPFNGAVSHCFNLNGMPNGSEVEGVDGIMAAYASALHNVALAGPTLFGPVINMAAEIAGQSLSHNDRSKYFVLLIITDGVLTDLQETKDALVRASDLPLSILTVGVGGAGRRISAVQALLEELPGQFLSYVRARDIKPRNLQVA